jgi:transcriptional regulator with XRE-family HTH domain
MAKLLGFPHVRDCCVSEYERGAREPDLLVLLRYAKIAKISVEMLIDDTLDLRLPLTTWQRQRLFDR